jgi:hypothetical protein
VWEKRDNGVHCVNVQRNYGIYGINGIDRKHPLLSVVSLHVHAVTNLVWSDLAFGAINA